MDVYHLYTNFYNYIETDCNVEHVWIISSLHMYHLIYHKNKINIQDIIHHIPTLFMQCIIPLLLNYKSIIISHHVFYLCGLPGCIDYLLLFLVRNGFILKITEKQINEFLNVWIRCPGTIINTAFIMIMLQDTRYIIEYIILTITMLFSYWNGLYYMRRVVIDYNNALTN